MNNVPLGQHTIAAYVREQKPHNPVHVFRPRALEKAAGFFLERFEGQPLFAVKTNPSPHVLNALYEAGISCFDVASLREIQQVYSLFPDAKLHFMHTVKSRHAIREAYFTFGVRDFSLDSTDELNKILEETNFAEDLNLYVRLAIPNTYAEMNLADKFGINLVEAVDLLVETRSKAAKMGVCFHVGSQCMHPDAYRIAIRMAKQTVAEAGVTIDMLDVGGGFPSVYPGMIPPNMQGYFDAIHQEFAQFPGRDRIQLMCEPGRALVAESGSVIVRVELRKGQHLYINDGTYGSLFDAGSPKFVFPVRKIEDAPNEETMMPFSFFGPTCDTLDFMKGPFYLPSEIREGDYIEIGQLGAYGKTLATNFNGFGPDDVVVDVSDEPLMTMYGNEAEGGGPVEHIAA